MGFFLRVRPDAATTLTVEGTTFEGVEVSDPELASYQGRWGKGATIHTDSEEDARRLEAAGFEQIDDSFAAVRLGEKVLGPPGVDLSNDRVVGVVEDALPSLLASGHTEADLMLHQLAAFLKTSGLDEETFREQLRADPRLSVYAGAEFPGLRCYISRSEAIGLIAADEAEPIYADADEIAAEFSRLLDS